MNIGNSVKLGQLALYDEQFRDARQGQTIEGLHQLLGRVETIVWLLEDGIASEKIRSSGIEVRRAINEGNTLVSRIQSRIAHLGQKNKSPEL